MATARNVAERALRKLGLIQVGEDAPLALLENALAGLADLYRTLIATGMFGRIKDVQITGDYTAGENERIRGNSLSEAINVTLPVNVESEGVERVTRNRSFVTVIDPFMGTTSTWLYDAYAGGWVSLDGLGLESVAPLSEGLGADGLASLLAVTLADEHGVDLSPLTIRAAGRFKSGIGMSLDGERQTVTAEYF